MPVFLRYTGYKIFFWSNENNEPIHFHIAEGDPSSNSTKIWILEDDSFLMANNNNHIPLPVLRRILMIMQDNIDDYKKQWEMMHGEIKYYK